MSAGVPSCSGLCPDPVGPHSRRLSSTQQACIVLTALPVYKYATRPNVFGRTSNFSAMISLRSDLQNVDQQHCLAELPVHSPEPKRPTRYAFVARVKATDLISGMQLDGLTSDLSEGGCCVMTRRAPFSPDTCILLQITKSGVSLSTHATVIYNLKDEVMGLRFDDMLPDDELTLHRWLKAAIPIAHRDRARVP